MTGQKVWLLAAIMVGTASQAFVGWWALALVGFLYGVGARSQPWSPLQFGSGVALAGAALLGWLAWTGQPVAEMHQILSDLTAVPVLTLSLLLPGLTAFTGAYLGVALGRRVLFG